MSELLERAYAAREAKHHKRILQNVDRQELRDLIVAFLNGRLGATEVAQVLGCTRSNIGSVVSSLLRDEISRGAMRIEVLD